MPTKKIYSALIKIALFAMVALLWRCQVETDFAADPQENETIESLDMRQLPEQAFPEASGNTKKTTYRNQEIIVEELESDYILEGDIKIPRNETDLDSKAVGRSDTDYLWPDNKVYYKIDSNVYDASIVEDAIAHWVMHTNLRFSKRNTEKNYIVFVSGSGCSSYVGKQGGAQPITVGSKCTVGNVIHEIGHAVGLWHEHSRADASKYITVHEKNITSGKEHNFLSYQETNTDGAEYTAALDFESIMMYDSYSFSKNGSPTITKKNGSTFASQRYYLSENDLKGIASMYPKWGFETKSVTLKGNNNRFVSSENGYTNITINRIYSRSWETFELIYQGDGWYAFRASNGKYLSSENGLKPMTCNRAEPRSWEKFKIEQKSGNQYYIKGSNGLYVSSNDGDENLGLTCDRRVRDLWEVFTISGL